MNKGNICLLNNNNNIKQESTSLTTSNKLLKLEPNESGVEPKQDVKIEPNSFETHTLASIKTYISDTENPIELFINNVVCSYSTRCHLNLRKIATEGMHVEYKKENGMVNMKLRKPYTTATIWSSGKVTCAGAKSEQDAYKAARRYCRLLERMKFKVRMSNYRVVNVLATCNMPFSLDIARLAEKYQKECSYEPELHPGATFKIKELKSTLKLFTTGSITLTSPSVDLAQQSIVRIYPILVEFKRYIINDSNNQNTPKLDNQTNNNQSIISTIKLNNNLNSNNWLYQPIKTETTSLTSQTNGKFSHQSPINSSLFPPSSTTTPSTFHLNHHLLHTTYSEPLLYSANFGSTINTNSLSPSLGNTFHLHHHHHQTPSYLSVHTSNLNSTTTTASATQNNTTSSGSILFSPTNTSSTSLYSSNGSSHQTQAPNHWFYDNLLIDNNVVDDFLP